MNRYDLRERTYKFGLSIVMLANKFPRNISAQELGRQLIRSGTSIGANSEEADGASSRKDFVYKIHIAKREAAETRYWLRMIIDSKLLNNENNIKEAQALLGECSELVKILSSILQKSKEKIK
ncbi:four helix bundle protein [Candidatus Margulisiibacteriota bacterium]